MDQRTKTWYEKYYDIDLRVDADTNTLFDVLRTWVDDVNNITHTKQTQVWCLMLKYILEEFNCVPTIVKKPISVKNVQTDSAQLLTLQQSYC